MTQFTRRSLLLKKEVQGFYMRLPFQLATPPGFHATHIPKGNLVPGTVYDIYVSYISKVPFREVARGVAQERNNTRRMKYLHTFLELQ